MNMKTNLYKSNFHLAVFLLLVMMGCANQDLVQDTAPAEVTTLEEQRGISDDPIPVMTFITIEYPRGFDRAAFVAEFGPEFGLMLVGDCPSNLNREIWHIDYVAEEDFQSLLDTIFAFVEPPGTQSGGGGYNAYVKYQSSSSTSANAGFLEIIPPVEIFYGMQCN